MIQDACFLKSSDLGKHAEQAGLNIVLACLKACCQAHDTESLEQHIFVQLLIMPAGEISSKCMLSTLAAHSLEFRVAEKGQVYGRFMMNLMQPPAQIKVAGLQ